MKRVEFRPPQKTDNGFLRGQGAIVKPSAASARRSLGRTTIELSSCSTAGTGNCLAHQTIAPLFALQKEGLHGQGATEYLVLLAVVLIVALVSVALLGFFPGMASDAQLTQSKTYWSSASPIAITELAAWGTNNAPTGRGLMYMRLRNNGNYPITITKIIGTNSTNYISRLFRCDTSAIDNLSSVLAIAPGEETYVGYPIGVSGICREIDFYKASGTSSSYFLYNIASDCLPAQPYGTLQVNNFGFEYIERIEGQTVTKRQIGTAPLIAKCGSPAW